MLERRKIQPKPVFRDCNSFLDAISLLKWGGVICLYDKQFHFLKKLILLDLRTLLASFPVHSQCFTISILTVSFQLSLFNWLSQQNFVELSVTQRFSSSIKSWRSITTGSQHHIRMQWLDFPSIHSGVHSVWTELKKLQMGGNLGLYMSI